MKSTTKAKDHEKSLIVHYTHEKRFASMKRDIHGITNDVFSNTPIQDLKMTVGTSNRRSARNDLVHKRPNRSLLRDQPRKRKQPIVIPPMGYFIPNLFELLFDRTATERHNNDYNLSRVEIITLPPYFSANKYHTNNHKDFRPEQPQSLIS